MSIPGWTHVDSPFHAGEQFVQQKLGVGDQVERFARRVVRRFMPEQHRVFYGQLPFVTIGHVDPDGNPWASILVGRPGFISSPNAHSLHFTGQPLDGDPLATSLAPGLQLGLLGLEPSSRRRNRVAGEVSGVDKSSFSLSIGQAFGNCPQYIQTREIRFVREPGDTYVVPPVETLDTLDDAARAMIEGADTFFVASASSDAEEGPSGGADVSHRGGNPGFVRIEGDTLTIPDFSGNNHFNTLGNFVVNPRAGLLFVDFERGDVLLLSGAVEIVWEGPEVETFKGAQRLWRFHLKSALRLRDRLAARWVFGEHAPDNARTGNWVEASAALKSQSDPEQYRDFEIIRVVDESDEIRSFHLAPVAGSAAPFLAGQHLPIRVRRASDAPWLHRNYTLSSAPSDEIYRISVKREPGGVVSNLLHDHFAVGATIETKAPRGNFIFDPTNVRPAVLLSGGVGITPTLSMLRETVIQQGRGNSTRRLTFIHAARTTDSRAFFAEVTQIEATAKGVQYLSVIGKVGAEDEDYHHAGYVTQDLLRQTLALDDYEFYLCGPGGFMQAMYDAIRGLGVSDARILAETFGPSTLTRQPDVGVAPASRAAPAAEFAIVEFAGSKFEMSWTQADGSLLELAEGHGLQPAYGCRGGSCGNCAVKVHAGEITYKNPPSAAIADGHALICVGFPAKTDGSERVVLAL